MTPQTQAQPVIPVLEKSWRPRVHPDLIVDDKGEDIILLHPRQARWALTNRMGLHLTSQFDGSQSLGELADQLSSQFGMTDSSAILDDIRQFVMQLYETNMLENAPLPHQAPSKPKKSAPPSMTVYITEECNLRCKHCAIVEGKMPKPTLTTDDVKDLIDQHTQKWGDHVRVSFIGGEPMIREDCMELLQYARAKSDDVVLNTNGLLIDDSVAKFLADLDVWVQISLDGADPEIHNFLRGKNKFEKTWQAVELLAKYGAAKKTIIATVLTKCFLPDLQHMIQMADDAGIFLLRFLTLNKLKAADTNWEKIAPEGEEMLNIYRFLLLELPKHDRTGKPIIEASFPGFVPNAPIDGDAWCPLGKTLVVDSQGHTYNCPTFKGPKYATGNVHHESLEKITTGEKNRQLRQEMLGRRYAVPECAKCEWRNFCQGGCTAFSTLRTDDYYANDEFCEFRRELYRNWVHRVSNGQFDVIPDGPACAK